MATIVPFLPFLLARDGAFDEDATRVMGEAFDAACKELGEISDLAREAVADRIIATAKRGERDPLRLRNAGIAAIRPPLPKAADRK